MTEQLKNELKASHGREIFIDFLNARVKKHELIDAFDTLTDLYLQVNSVINISALKKLDDIYIKHYLDSAAMYEYFDGDACDVGCGGGFPTLPIAIITGLNVTGVDSVGKKLLLIHRAVAELNIKNVKTEYSRSEDLVKMHKSYDTTCCRALADVDKALTFCAPLTKQGGKIILYRTQNDAPAKIQTEQKLKITLIDDKNYTLPGTDINRKALVYKKL